MSHEDRTLAGMLYSGCGERQPALGLWEEIDAGQLTLFVFYPRGSRFSMRRRLEDGIEYVPAPIPDGMLLGRAGQPLVPNFFLCVFLGNTKHCGSSEYNLPLQLLPSCKFVPPSVGIVF